MHHRKRTVLPLGGAVLVIAVLMLVSRDGETEIERLAALLEIRPGDTVADVGAGDGWLRPATGPSCRAAPPSLIACANVANLLPLRS